MRTLWLVPFLILSGCVNATMLCPDKVSKVSYSGLALTSNISVSCVGSPLTGGNVVQVSGVDILALAMAVAPLVAAMPAPNTSTTEPLGPPDPNQGSDHPKETNPKETNPKENSGANL